MKHRFALLSFFAAMLCSVPVNAQESLPPAQDVVPLPASTASTAENHLNPLHQEEWVVLDASGSVRGQVAQLTAEGTSRPVERVTLHLSRNGAPVANVITDPEGRFVLPGLGVGTYGLIGRSDRTIAAFALHVLPAGASTRLDSDFVVYGTTTYGPIINEVFRAHTVPGNGEAVYPDFRTDPVGDARRFSDNSQIALRANGLLAGRVSKPNGLNGEDLSGNVVHILKNGVIVGHEPTNARGEFQVASMSPGVYDFVVAGKDGIAAGSFQAIDGAGLAQKASASTRLVTAVQPPADSLNVELVPADDFGNAELVDPVVIEEPGFFPIPGGGFAGPGGFAGGGAGGGFGGGAGGGAGGGGIGGIGGIGGLLGIGGLAAGVAALASDDDGFDTVAASLVVP
ncbi:MAG: carboxypeptidase regulatory-like domain-containing protein [Pirellulaceae bacterium]|nr:carboxypeptidase regulatory-like domain-containing protein [Pirellulaceae bacterium]